MEITLDFSLPVLFWTLRGPQGAGEAERAGITPRWVLLASVVTPVRISQALLLGRDSASPGPVPLGQGGLPASSRAALCVLGVHSLPSAATHMGALGHRHNARLHVPRAQLLAVRASD